ncbi:putative 3TM holin [Alteromonadaceae bacterium 2753L.S.0a.02]|nr:putative 3TM holin [Alteromonadaceae bacterium 2753L.S.0a.02]
MITLLINIISFIAILATAVRLLTFRRGKRRYIRIISILAWLHVVALYLEAYCLVKHPPQTLTLALFIFFMSITVLLLVLKRQGNIAKMYQFQTPKLRHLLELKK